MNKIDLVTLQHSLDCETARLKHERFCALQSASDSMSAQKTVSESFSPLLETVSACCDAVDLLLTLKTAPGPDLPEEEYRAHAAAQMLLDEMTDHYARLDAALDDDNALGDATRSHVDALRQELVRERIAAVAAELEPLMRQLAIPNAGDCVSALLEELNHHLSAESDSAMNFSGQAAEKERDHFPGHASKLRRMADRHEMIAVKLRACVASLSGTDAAGNN